MIKRRYSRLYYIFHGIKHRCSNPEFNGFKHYGGKGIQYSWSTFKEFENDMQKSYQEHVNIYGERDTTIDRIDNNKNYCKENCRWATRKEQGRNRSCGRYITYQGETKNVSEWSEMTGINYQTFISRINKKWSVDRIFSKV